MSIHNQALMMLGHEIFDPAANRDDRRRLIAGV
jgi:hypothetical protein